jgi:hypothetical protein
VRHSKFGFSTSALGQKQTSRSEIAMSALPPKADISPILKVRTQRRFLPLPLERRVMACPKAQNYTTTDLQSCDYVNLGPAKWGSAISLHGSKLLRLVMCFVGVLP